MTFSRDEGFARRLDAEDPLRHFREKFHLPLGTDGKPFIYFAGPGRPNPARTTVEVTALPTPIGIELKVIAAVG